MPKKITANLFRFEANLLRDGNIELIMNSPDEREVENLLASGVPEYDGAHAVASVMRYLKTMGNEMMDKSRNFIN
jgi:acylphosphatase